MRLTIERIRTLVLVAAVLLMAAMGVFLARAKWKNLLTRRDLPERLARNIIEESNGFNYSHNLGANSKFKIHASKAVELKNDRVELHDVQIELYGKDGNRIDRIAGDTFEYDQKSGLAIAEGPVEMLLTRPAAAPKAGVAGNASAEIELKTSGVTFDQDTGLVATAKRVDFTMKQSQGSAVGALYDSQKGYLTLDHAVELKTERGGEPVEIEAQRAEFDRSAQACTLHAAKLDYRHGEANAAQARIFFRTDGSARQLDATGGFTIVTATGGRLTAPSAQMEFDEHNQPLRGQLDGGVTIDSVTESRAMHGTAPTATLAFTAHALLRQAILERGVFFQSEETSQASAGQNAALRVTRTWRSAVADMNFIDAGKGRLQLESIRGTGGVAIANEIRRGGAAAVPSTMTADEITATFGQGTALRTLTGVGHAAIEQTTATGTRQTASGDRLEAQFAEVAEQTAPPIRNGSAGTRAGSRAAGEQETRAQASVAPDVQTAELDGHVVLVEQPAAKPGAQTQPPIRATAGKAVYEETGQWIHLTMSPRVEYGGLQLTAEKVDLSEQSGDAFAHSNVKGSWTGEGTAGTAGQSAAANGDQGPGTMTFGGKGPVHVIAAEAQLNESTGEATFRGHARLWQMANSVSGPVIVLNQHLQTLAAQSSNSSEPVRAVLLSAGGPASGLGQGTAAGTGAAGGPGSRPAAPAVIRVSGGELEYYEAERRAVMRGGALGAVDAETGTATSSSDAVDLRLMPATNPDGTSSGQNQVDRMTATGHVKLTSQGRTGSGDQLVYSSVTGEYVLTGTASTPPRLTDPVRGTVTGEALIFNSRDDSVSIEGGGHETVTQTTAPEVHRK